MAVCGAHGRVSLGGLSPGRVKIPKGQSQSPSSINAAQHRVTPSPALSGPQISLLQMGQSPAGGAQG